MFRILNSCGSCSVLDLIVSCGYWSMICMLVLSPLWSGKSKFQHRLTSSLKSARAAFLLNKLAYPVLELLLGISLWHHLLYVMTFLSWPRRKKLSGVSWICPKATVVTINTVIRLGKVRFSQSTTQIEWNLSKTNIQGQSVRNCYLLWRKQHIWVLFERNLR